ncbi:MAG: ABC transporter ATP-binding protein [Deltaproteobacteria bacterium]|nr:ABC transporter ATP-binding protein [Deltaproteobacteria bacterium]MBM4347368.1 ABC transporter ATP-binding protein [Deltaproteobacteria bacterium]
MPLLEITDLSKEFDGLRALDRVGFSADPAEILGVIGPNGAGKTTLFNIISGIFPPTQGKIIFQGEMIYLLKPHQISRLGIGRTFQLVRPFQNLDVETNILVASGHSFYPSFRKSFTPSQKPEVLEEVQKLIDRTGLRPYARQISKNLPLGIKKRLEIARALALKPRLLLLDEPSGGLRFEESAQLMELIREIREEGIGILLIEHNMQVIMDLCKRIVVLDHGSKIAEGSPEEIRSNPQVIQAYLGKES